MTDKPDEAWKPESAGRLNRNNERHDDTVPFALRIWEQSTPLAGTLAETYLRARNLPLIGEDAPRRSSHLRPVCWHPGTSRRFRRILALANSCYLRPVR
jgi:hypothetical protein